MPPLTASAGVVLSNGSLSTQTVGESVICKNLVEDRIVDCIVGLPDRLFYNTGIPTCIWFLTLTKKNRGSRENEILFINARNLGQMINRKNQELSNEDINTIAGLYHNWRSKDGSYSDITGLCKSAAICDVNRQGYFLAPRRYVGIPEENEPDFCFEQKFKQQYEELLNQMKMEEELNRSIKANLDLIEV